MSKENEKLYLRIGIIERGKLVEERVFKKDEDITIGRSSKNTLVLPYESCPTQHRLFQWRQGGYTLYLPKGAEGKVSSQKGVQDLVNQPDSASFEGSLDTPAFALTQEMRGKIRVGESTLLFQFVTAPAESPQAPLPFHLRGWRPKVDWVYASVMLLSFLGHSGVIAYFSLRAPSPPELSDSSRFRKLIYETPLVVAPPPKEQPKVLEKEKNKPKENRETKRPTRSTTKHPKPTRPTKSATERRQDISKRIEDSGILSITQENNPWMQQVLSKQSGAAFSERLNQLKPGAASQDHGTLLRTRGQGVATDITQEIRREGTCCGGGGPGKFAGPPSITSRRKATKLKTKGILDIRPIPSIPQYLNEDRLKQFIRRRKGAIAYCYEKSLRLQPDQKGRVEVRMIIKTTGKINVEIESNDLSKSVGTCIRKILSRYRLLPPPKEEAEVLIPFFFEPRR